MVIILSHLKLDDVAKTLPSVSFSWLESYFNTSLGGALGVELPVAGGTGVLGGGGSLGLGRDPGLNLAVAGVLRGGGGGVACCCGVATLADMM